MLLSDPTHRTGEPQVAVGPSGNVYVVWGGWPIGCGASNIYFARSVDGAGSFSAPSDLSGIPCDSDGSTLAYNAKVAVDAAETVYVIWDRVGTGGPPPNQVYFTRSTDGGQTFTAPKNISNSPPVTPSFGAVVPDLAASGPGEVWVAWVDRYDQDQLEQIFVSHSTDRGDTFTPPVQVSFRPAGWSDSGHPAVAAKPGGLVLVGWGQTQVGAVGDVYLVRSSDSGNTFSALLSLSQGFAPSSHLELAADAGERVYASWMARLSRSYETFFSRSVDDGATFLERRRITRKRHGSSIIQGLAVGRAGQVCIAWTEVRKDEDIFARCSFDGGETFRRRFNASGPLGWEQGDIALDAAGNLYVVFGGDLRSINPDATWTGVYFRRSLEPLQ